MRYYIFNFQDDTTLFIEDSSVDKVRDDNKLTYYQFPPDYNIQDNKGLSVSKKINRSLVSRKIYFIGKDTEQLSVYIFYPNQTDILLDIENQSKFDKTIESVFGFSFHKTLNNFKMTSDFDITKHYEKLEFLEIPITGGQLIYVPKGFWFYTDDTSMLRQM
jgi:hypothetical protein|tara:strand:+ start:2544 stop:3026 length:483 start_codon:yes stop_codon:yes gene_type:complete